MDIKTNMTKG